MAAGRLHAADALLPSGWAPDVLIEWDGHGVLTGVTPRCGPGQTSGVARARGPVLPGMPNLHSHAFQRVFAGVAERRGSASDSFWTWRNRMYAVANAITPETLETVATWLFVEMLEAGYTSVCEFHYLHHDPDGRPYADRATLAACVIRAARRAGIGLTLLPVLYQHGGFGGADAGSEQRRFLSSTDRLLELVGELGSSTDKEFRVGLALHSLRAVAPEAMRDALRGLADIDASAPIHIHVAEQVREVEECLAWSGQRPVEWLVNHLPLDARWCLVHATHLSNDEARHAAALQVVAGLCPSTEANLGDGVFELSRWSEASPSAGRWGIGSDSHVTVDAADELRLLEHSQRLRTGRRSVAATSGEPHLATAMMLAGVAGGAAASGRAVGGLAAGQRADFVVLNEAHHAIGGLPAPDALSVHVFACSRVSAIDTVVVGGRRLVEGGRHPLHDEAAASFVRARAALADATAS